MFSGLARAFESALARTGGRELSKLLEGWWGPLLAALLIGMVAFLIFRALKLRRSAAYAALTAMAALALVAAIGPLTGLIEQSDLTRRSQQAVRSALIDPTSAQIETVLIRKFDNGNRTICGWVNARARNGAYQGPQMFAVRLRSGEAEARVNIDPACPLSGYRLTRDCEPTIHDRARFVYIDGPAERYCPIDRNP